VPASLETKQPSIRKALPRQVFVSQFHLNRAELRMCRILTFTS
jgi:hypothetical protein